ncbi:MAG: winged helix-turn-helix domain-containing protein [Blastocatellia bacterium]|nr:winged helix-turn-helix domain-containing protein [Blastocatellia bacterium]
MPRTVKRYYEFDSFRLDLSARVLMRDSAIIPLTPKALDTLVVLVERCGELVGRAELLRAVWPDVFVEENNLNSNIFMLRRALGAGNYIATIPRRGYRFMASVREVVVDEGSEELQPKAGLSLLPIQKVTKYRSLAILPFKAISTDGCDGCLGLGMTDALITRLSNRRDLAVRPTSISAKYRGFEQEPISAGREMEVELILEGSIQRSGDRIRVTVQLVSVTDGASFWAEKFDELFTDIFEVEDALSVRIADALMTRLSEEDAAEWNRCAA